MEKEEAFTDKQREELVEWAMEHYGEEIKRVIFTYVKDHAVVDDLSQEVFMKVYRNLHSFRGDSEWKTWIYRIAINTSKDYLKSFKHRVHQIILPLLSNGEQTEAKVVTAEERVELAAYVMQLPLKYREVLVLHYYRDFSVEEISVLLEVNKNTIKTRLKRGRDRIKACMMEGGGYFEEEQSLRKRSF